jgi:hypothetical protein
MSHMPHMKERGLDKVEPKQADIIPLKMQQEKGVRNRRCDSAERIFARPAVPSRAMKAYCFTTLTCAAFKRAGH